MLLIPVANAERVALEVLADVLEPPPPVDLEQWAVDNISFADGDFPGPYNPALFPFWSEILAALGPDDPCRNVTLAGSAQIGKTIVANVFTLGTLDLDPGPMGYVHPTEQNGSIWSRQKLAPMIRSNPRLARLFPEQGRERGNSILFKERSDGRGFLKIAGANSPAGLSMQTWERQVQDDVAKYEINSAGDPEEQAESRSKAIEFRAKIFKLSTHLLADSCRITRNYLAGTQEKYHVPCPHCETLRVLEWENMREATGDDAPPEQACFSCVSCGGLIEERHRAWMVDRANGAKWIAKHPERRAKHRSFWIWSAYAPLMSWARIIEEWRTRRGIPAKEQVFINDTAGLPFDGDSEGPALDALIARAEQGHERGIIPLGTPLLFAGIDVQEDRIEWAIWGFGENGRRSLVQWGEIPVPITDARAHDQLNGLLTSTWPTSSGRRVMLDGLAIDGNYDTAQVFQWVKRKPLRRVMMVRGVAGAKPSILHKVGQTKNTTGKRLRYGGRFFNVAVDHLKLNFYRALKIADPDAPYFVALPLGYDQPLIEQLTAERREQRKSKSGHLNVVWALPPGRRNEQLDMANYAEAASLRFGIESLTEADWMRIRADRETAPDEPQLDLETVAEASAPVAQSSRRPRRAARRRTRK